jgi:hypothetical protein
VGTGLAAAGALALGPEFWRHALAAPAVPGPGPYGELQPPDANGVQLPPGFTSREIARANQLVPGTAYPWHVYPDGQATFALSDGGWVLVSNSESLAASGAGSSAIRFAADGEITDAYRILAGTNSNCAGGPTPWGAWLSCEEHDGGQVWECDPLGQRPALNRPALGVFNHEAVAVDPLGGRLYMTEDEGNGCFYRFTPASYPDLSSGSLEVAVVDAAGSVTWAAVPDPSRITSPTREQVPNAARFNGGEGIWYDSGFVYFTTKGDNRVWSYDLAASTLEVVYDHAATPDAPLRGVDNITVSPYGDLYVCEDGGNMEICLITPGPDREVAAFLRLPGPEHNTGEPRGVVSPRSEVAGVVFDPWGTRMYFSSQRAHGYGVVYEVTGPFRMPAEPGADPAPQPLDAPSTRHTGGGSRSGRPPDREDTNGPGLRMSAARRVSLAALLRRGMNVNVSVERPGTVTLALRTSDLERVPGNGSTERPSLVTLAVAESTFAAPGRKKLHLRPGRRARARLRGRRRLTARLTAQAVDRQGQVTVANRGLRVGGKRQ